MGLRGRGWVKSLMQFTESRAACGFRQFDTAVEIGMISRWLRHLYFDSVGDLILAKSKTLA
jgi:hypothetical protein